MDRTIPSSGNEEIQLYVRTYYSLLRSTRAVPIKTLEEAHKGMHSALHIGADASEPDMAAFIYAILRLPQCFYQVRLVVMGQSALVFATYGYADLGSWHEVDAPGRRRRSFYDGDKTLAVFIASRSDIDDLIPILTAYQIERRKLRRILNRPAIVALLDQMDCDSQASAEVWCEKLAVETGVPADDWERLHNIWREKMPARLLDIAQNQQEIALRSLSGSLADYKRATRHWWMNVDRTVSNIDFETRPVYFISSNIHSMANLLTGYPLLREDDMNTYIHARGSEALQQEYHDILEQNVPSSRENFLYYAWKKFESAHPGAEAERIAYERSVGLYRVPSEQNAFDIEVQVVDVRDIHPDRMDARLHLPGFEKLAQSEALIVNVDYPLGMAAYQVLTEIARNIAEIRGVFIMGKAATLNGHIGDVMIPGVVHDEQSLNTYLFNNCFTADEVAPYLVYGTVLDNQKAITVPGTFLQNEVHMSVFHTEGYTDMEMEAGPYLSSIYEMVRPKRYPHNEVVDLHSTPFPVGILHYASDTPFSKGKNLGSRNLSYYGMDPTYATMIAILRELLGEEIRRSG